MSTQADEQTPVEPEENDPPLQRWIVRYGRTRILGEFTSKRAKRYRRGDQVILKTDRGMEWGETLCEATDAVVESLHLDKTPGRILRPASRDDHRLRDSMQRQSIEDFEGCGKMIAERKMQMQLVDTERLLGGERIIFYYLAEKRVDFRELVRALNREFKTRIEMRHIGVRDEAKLLADYGDCGKPVCCNTHLQEMPRISMKMAKIQKEKNLDPSKISGRCGRLKCCLRYEYDTYVEYQKELPPVNSTVVTRSAGEGRVLRQEILARKVLVEFDRTRRILVGEDDIVTVVKRPRKSDGKSKPEGKPDAG